MSDSSPKLSKRSELAETLWRFRSAFIGVAAFSALINLLMLTGPLFMLQVYDRVLPSRSVPTLVALMLLMAALYAFQAALEGTRGRLLVRLGYYLDEALSPRLYNAVVRLPLKLKGGGNESQPMQDVDHIRGFFSSGGPSALADLPWAPLYLAICFVFHPLIGVTALVGGGALSVIAICAEAYTRAPTRSAAAHQAKRNALLRRVAAMPRSYVRWEWRAGSVRAGPKPMPVISALNGRRPMSQAGWEPCRAPFVCSCNS